MRPVVAQTHTQQQPFCWFFFIILHPYAPNRYACRFPHDFTYSDCMQIDFRQVTWFNLFDCWESLLSSTCMRPPRLSQHPGETLIDKSIDMRSLQPLRLRWAIIGPSNEKKSSPEKTPSPCWYQQQTWELLYSSTLVTRGLTHSFNISKEFRGDDPPFHGIKEKSRQMG